MTAVREVAVVRGVTAVRVISGELIVSKYVAESITMIAVTFWPRRPLSTAYVFAHDQFARYQQSSNEPLRRQSE